MSHYFVIQKIQNARLGFTTAQKVTNQNQSEKNGNNNNHNKYAKLKNRRLDIQCLAYGFNVRARTNTTCYLIITFNIIYSFLLKMYLEILYIMSVFSIFILTIMTSSPFLVLEELNGNDQKSSFDRIFYVKMHFWKTLDEMSGLG